MKRQQKGMTLLATLPAFIAVALLLPMQAYGGDLEPSAPPGPTMKTLDQIPPTWSHKLQCNLTGDIVVCPRFEPVMGGYAVLDKETGLVWERSPGTGKFAWGYAISHCYNKGVGGRKGFRLPTVEELASLVDPQATSPPYLPNGHPFSNVQSGALSDKYWSSTTNANSIPDAWWVDFGDGDVGAAVGKTSEYYVWCVRGGHGYDAY
jgi:hypothetical protein